MMSHGEVPVKEVQDRLDQGITALVLLKDALDIHRASGVLRNDSVTCNAVGDVAIKISEVRRVCKYSKGVIACLAHCRDVIDGWDHSVTTF